MAKTLNHYSQQIRALAPDALALDRARDLGMVLIEAKAAVKAAGKAWGEWLECDCALSARTAQRFMAIAKRWDEPAFAEARQARPDLPLREADKVLAATSSRKRREPEQPVPCGVVEPKLADLEHLWDPSAQPLFTDKPPEWVATYLPRYCRSVSDRTESDCRGLALVVRELHRNDFWQQLFPDWETCCQALFKRPAAWVEQVVEGVRVLHSNSGGAERKTEFSSAAERQHPKRTSEAGQSLKIYSADASGRPFVESWREVLAPIAQHFPWIDLWGLSNSGATCWGEVIVKSSPRKKHQLTSTARQQRAPHFSIQLAVILITIGRLSQLA